MRNARTLLWLSLMERDSDSQTVRHSDVSTVGHINKGGFGPRRDRSCYHKPTGLAYKLANWTKQAAIYQEMRKRQRQRWRRDIAKLRQLATEREERRQLLMRQHVQNQERNTFASLIESLKQLVALIKPSQRHK